MIKGLDNEKVLNYIKKVEKELKMLYAESSLAIYCIDDLVNTLEMYLGCTDIEYSIKRFNYLIKNFKQVFFEEEKECIRFIKQCNGALSFAVLVNFDVMKTAELMVDIAIKKPFILTQDVISNLK